MTCDNFKASCLARGVQNCGLHVCILGTIGAGKTTLSETLQDVIKEKELKCLGFFEPVKQNPILPLYYQDPKRYAMTMQIYMLNKRFEQQMCIQDYCLHGVSCVQDSSVFGDTCFVEMLMKDGILSDEEVNVYAELFQNISRFIMYPSFVVYLNCKSEVAVERIAKRGREFETGISKEYVDNLNKEIKHLCEEMKRYTYVEEIDVSEDMNEEQIRDLAYYIYDKAIASRNNPIISRIGL